VSIFEDFFLPEMAIVEQMLQLFLIHFYQTRQTSKTFNFWIYSFEKIFKIQTNLKFFAIIFDLWSHCAAISIQNLA
jgi:hypothetical protein